MWVPGAEAKTRTHHPRSPCGVTGHTPYGVNGPTGRGMVLMVQGGRYDGDHALSHSDGAFIPRPHAPHFPALGKGQGIGFALISKLLGSRVVPHGWPLTILLEG